MTNVSFGKIGEQAACEYLHSKGFKIIEQNFRCLLGEIDIVARDGGVLVFVEVKTRFSTQYGQPFESVTYHKQKRLIKLAQVYMKYKHGTVAILSRFDVVSILMKDRAKEITHIKNAFFRLK